MTRRRTLATSLAPSPVRRIGGGREIGHLVQFRCVESWRRAGLDIVSVNTAEESEAVSAAYPDVPVVVARRDMRTLCGRPLIPIDEMVRVLRDAGVVRGGIAQADVFVAEPDRVRPLVERDGTVVFGCIDVEHPYGGNPKNSHAGSAAVFFDVAAAAGLDLDPFAVGLPGWSHALALSLIETGAGALRPPDSLLQHLVHPDEWDDDLHRYFAETFRSRFTPLFERWRRMDRAAALPALVAIAGADHIIAADEARTDQSLLETNSSASDRRTVAGRHRTAYVHAVADLIREWAAVGGEPRPGRP